MADSSPGLTDIHAHPAMNSWLWHRDLRRHYWTGKAFDPLASLTDFKMLEKGGVKVLWSSLHIPEHDFIHFFPLWIVAHLLKSGRKLLHKTAWECLLDMKADMEDQVGRTEGRFRMAGSNAELDEVIASGNTAIVHTVEGGHVLSAGLEPDDIATRLARVDHLASGGVASLTIAHLFPNDLAGHADAIPPGLLHWFFKSKIKVDPDRGLTPAGRAVIERMVERRIIPDVAHCTPAARREIYALVANRIPVIASHVGVSSLNGVPYNLDREDVEAIAASGGVVGVIFMPVWLQDPDPKVGLEAVWRTMETVREWSGGTWDHAAIGTDFDGFTDPADDCDSEAQLPRVEDRLESHGLSRVEVDAVLGGNARRVLRDGWV
jgi:membrane dipeptidase